MEAALCSVEAHSPVAQQSLCLSLSASTSKKMTESNSLCSCNKNGNKLAVFILINWILSLIISLQTNTTYYWSVTGKLLQCGKKERNK